MSGPVNHVHKTYPCPAATVCSYLQTPGNIVSWHMAPVIFLCILISQRQRNRTQGILITHTPENINMNKTGNNCVKNTSRIINQPDVSHYVITHCNVAKYNTKSIAPLQRTLRGSQPNCPVTMLHNYCV